MTMRMKTDFSRRGFLASGAMALSLGALGCGREQAAGSATAPTPSSAAAVPEQFVNRLTGLQLYTVRDAMAKNMDATLQRLADIGFGEVEFAGYFDKTPAEVKTILASTGLAAPSAHVSRDLIRDNPDPSIEMGAEIGHEWLVLNWLAPEERETIDQYKEWADISNRFAEKVRAAGMKFAWHNHDFEFQPIAGIMPYDVLMAECDRDLVKFELDLYWAKKAGQDIPALLARDPDRFPMCHVKDMDAEGNMADVGEGTIDFTGLFESDVARFEHFFVERDDAPKPFQTAATGHASLSEILNTAYGE